MIFYIIYFGIVFFLKRYHPLLTKIEDLNSKVYSNESAKVVDNYTALGLNEVLPKIQKIIIQIQNQQIMVL